MKKLRFLTLVLFLLPLLMNGKAFSQEPWDYKNQVKFTPVRMINLLNPGFEVSYERKYAKRLATQVSMAYLVDYLYMTPYKDYEGFRILVEEKLYFHKKKFFMQYASVEGGYYTANMMNSADFIPEGIKWGSDEYYDSQYKDSFNLKRSGIILNAKYGVQMMFDRFTMDFCAGLGVIAHNIVHSNRAHPDDKMVSPDYLDIHYMAEKEGKHSMITFPISFKIGYAF